MGIPKLTTFIHDHFTQWKNKVVEGRLVVDGKNLCHHLYKSLDIPVEETHIWQYGGQYPQFHKHVLGYFRQLKESNIKAIVVYDGIDYKEEKVKTTKKRKEEMISTLSAAMATGSTSPRAPKPLPLLSLYEFQCTLSDPRLGVEQVVVDGEADIVIAQLANYYKCPVLSQDSDFYMCALEGGFIPIENFVWNEKVRQFKAEVYLFREFVDQFKLQHENMRLIIPAIVGNDFLLEVSDPSLTTEILSIVHHASQFKDAEEFISTLKNALRLQDNYRKCMEMYNDNCKASQSLEDVRKRTELRKFDKSAIPQWIIDQFKSCSFIPSLMAAYVLQKSILCVAIDDHVYHRESSLLISRPIRQALYSILGIGRVTEHVRVKEDNWNVIEEQNVFASNSMDLPRLEDVPFLSLTEKRRVLYSILGCGDQQIDSLVSYPELRLVAASIAYWRAHANPPTHVVNALLLCFIQCFTGCNIMQVPHTPAVDSRDCKLLSTIHYFAQWQSTYRDAISLKQVLQPAPDHAPLPASDDAPLPALSPGKLYDGKLAVSFAYAEERVIKNSEKELGQYETLYKVLQDIHSCAVSTPAPAAAKGSHSEHAKAPSSLYAVKTQNRFDLLETLQ